jgi:general secretion pathway protein H
MRWLDRGRDSAAGARAAFTLLEILLSLALIAMLAGVLITGAVRLIGDKPATPEDVFWKTVQEARGLALREERDIQVTFDPAEKVFLVHDGKKPKEMPVPAGRDLVIEFLAASSNRSTVLIGGDLVESRPIPSVTFFADGTCSPFRLQIRNGGAGRTINIDPWTCARVLPKTEGTP